MGPNDHPPMSGIWNVWHFCFCIKYCKCCLLALKEAEEKTHQNRSFPVEL